MTQHLKRRYLAAVSLHAYAWLRAQGQVCATARLGARRIGVQGPRTPRAGSRARPPHWPMWPGAAAPAYLARNRAAQESGVSVCRTVKPGTHVHVRGGVLRKGSAVQPGLAVAGRALGEAPFLLCVPDTYAVGKGAHFPGLKDERLDRLTRARCTESARAICIPPQSKPGSVHSRRRCRHRHVSNRSQAAPPLHLHARRSRSSHIHACNVCFARSAICPHAHRPRRYWSSDPARSPPSRATAPPSSPSSSSSPRSGTPAASSSL